jgi:putative sigma-54 modulation protein
VALPWSHSIVSEAFHGIEADGARAPVVEGAAAPAPAQRSTDAGPVPELKVVRTEKFHAQPLSVADAIVQLNLLHEPFLVFRHDTDGRIAVVYRRDDGAYGLIETPPTDAAS